MITYIFTALSGYTCYRLWDLNRGFAIATIVCTVVLFLSGSYMAREESGQADVILNFLLCVYVVVAFVLSFIIK